MLKYYLFCLLFVFLFTGNIIFSMIMSPLSCLISIFFPTIFEIQFHIFFTFWFLSELFFKSKCLVSMFYSPLSHIFSISFLFFYSCHISPITISCIPNFSRQKFPLRPSSLRASLRQQIPSPAPRPSASPLPILLHTPPRFHH